MNLTSLRLVGAVVGLTAVLTLATVVLWSRLAGRGPVRILLRVVALLLCQAMAAVSMAAVVNRSFGFYETWSDLFPSTSTAQAAAQAASHLAPVTGRGTSAAASAQVALDASLGRQVAPRSSAPGRTVPFTLTREGMTASGLVYLPPQYDQVKYAGMRFPTVLVLAGYPGPVSTLVRRLEVPQTMSHLAATGQVRPMIMVLWSPTVAHPRDTECANVVGGPQVETYLAQDLPVAIDGAFRTNRHWGVMGASTGGFCAAKLAVRHPARFTSAVSFSGYLRTLIDGTTGPLFGGDKLLKNENDPLWLIEHRPVPPVALLLTASKDESDVYPQVQELVAHARAPLQVSTLIVPTGGHNFGLWVSELPTALEWLSARLA
jgi:enterochelin esterase-like enzyme